jgi:hypothetical protein
MRLSRYQLQCGLDEPYHFWNQDTLHKPGQEPIELTCILRGVEEEYAKPTRSNLNWVLRQHRLIVSYKRNPRLSAASLSLWHGIRYRREAKDRHSSTQINRCGEFLCPEPTAVAFLLKW